MTPPLLLALPGSEGVAARLTALLGADSGAAVVQRFPDGETYVRIASAVAKRDVILVATLDHPDEKLLPLVYLADAARDAGAWRVGLVAPYLAYLRQDRRFQEGEAITSRSFAWILSATVDWLVTVDPHLHRYRSLAELYTIRAAAVHVAADLGRWIAAEVSNPLIIGPDAESGQWANAVACAANAPAIILEKERHSATAVSVSVPEASRHADRTPVLIDDIISTAQTMIEAARHLRERGLRPPVCVAVHGIFAAGAYRALRDAGVASVVTCNTIPHETNAIDVMPRVADAVRGVLGVKA